MTEILREIGSTVAKLRASLAEAKKDLQRLQGLQNTLTTVLDGLWDAVEDIQWNPSESLFKEFLSLVSSGRILSVAAQAEQALGSISPSWISSGHDYAGWLGRGIAQLAMKKCADNPSPDSKIPAEILGKSFGLGYNDDLVDQLLVSLLFSRDNPMLPLLRNLVNNLARHEQRHFLDSTLRSISKRFLPLRSDYWNKSKADTDDQKLISGSAALLQTLTDGEINGMKSRLCAWLTRNPPYVSTSLYRAVIAALPAAEIHTVLEGTWAQFGDKLYIKHTPIIQQEIMAQILLICAGYTHRSNPMHVFVLARSGTHTTGTSERLASSSTRVRWLGMVVGNAVSLLVDKPDMRMNFDLEEMETEEAKWYQSLIYIDDKVGSMSDLRVPPSTGNSANPKTAIVKKKNVGSLASAVVKPKIVEVIEEDDDNLIPYGKPDSDREDDDEDATLVQRNKPAAPVYIRDLISGLQDTENYDRHYLSLISAAPLIRRKADFGNEVKDRCEELGSIFVSLPDTFDLDNFHELRLQGMIAVLIAQPKQMGPWYANTFFSGDYSLSQRASVLTALGLGARELGGFGGEQEAEKPFPSKTLPDRLHKLYSESSTINAVAHQLEQTMLRPVTTTKKKRTKIVRNDLARMVAESFFFPLTGRWQMHGQAKEIYTSPHLLPTYIHTLSILLSSAGPSTLSLPQMTSEFWDLLLSLRSLALRDAAILEAVLFALLTILSTNEDKGRLAEQWPRELVETEGWVKMVFGRLSDGEGGGGERCRVLAAGVLAGMGEVVERWRGVMVGEMGDFG